jgi:hypothetical protein
MHAIGIAKKNPGAILASIIDMIDIPRKEWWFVRHRVKLVKNLTLEDPSDASRSDKFQTLKLPTQEELQAFDPVCKA